jgi:nicotinate-nucleotide adenylyltransferase
MQRLGLFGGSFNPVHSGHLILAQTAEEELGLDRVFFILAAQSPFKQGRQPAPAQARLRWLNLALAGRSRWEVDTREIQREGPSYTIDTLRDYRRLFPLAQLFYVIGADHVASLPQWRAAEELSQLAEFLIVPRPGERPVSIPPPFRGRYLTGIPSGISSSLVRERLRQGQAVDLLVPPPVAEALKNELSVFNSQ